MNASVIIIAHVHIASCTNVFVSSEIIVFEGRRVIKMASPARADIYLVRKCDA